MCTWSIFYDVVLRFLFNLQSSSCADPEWVPGQVAGGGGGAGPRSWIVTSGYMKYWYRPPSRRWEFQRPSVKHVDD